MERQGVDVRIYTPKYKDDLFDRIGNGIEIEEVSLPTPPVFELYSDLLVANRLISKASRWADAVILHHAQSLAAYVMRKYSIPCIPFYHIDRWDWMLWGSYRPFARIYTLPLDALELRCLTEVPLVLTNSRSLSNAIQRHEPQAKVAHVSVGVDTSRFYPRWDRDEEFIMMAGRIIPKNNFELGIRSIIDTNYRMVIASIVETKTIGYYRRLRGLIAQEHLEDRVSFKELNDQALIDHYQKCSIFLSPRVFDYLGHAALEPMACGKPVIANTTQSSIEDNPPIIRCRSDPSEWRNAVSSLMDHPSIRTNLGRKSHAFVEDFHSLTGCVTQMLRLITPLVEGPKNNRSTPAFADL